jgi:hypothetical protein
MTPHDEQRLERLIHQTLRELPPRPAPPSLEARVLAAIAGQAARSWWRKSFVHWPVAARGAFMVLSVGVVLGVVRLMTDFDAVRIRTALAAEFRWVATLATLAGNVVEFFHVMLGHIPPAWLYGGLAFVAVMYAALFGLGAAAYRTLYASR